MNDLTTIANKYHNDKGTSGCPNPLHFTTVYADYFEKIRPNNLNILEIGLGSGSSVVMWQEYFPNAKINVMDIDPTYNCFHGAQFDLNRVTLSKGDQSNRKQLKALCNNNDLFDIIIDDGGHMMSHQQISLGALFPHLAQDGLYFIEDLHTSFWPHNGYSSLYGTDLDINEDRSNTTIRAIENYIKTKKMESLFLARDENDYLTNNITDCRLFELPETEYGPNRLALFKK
tara:strand:- start:1022 stop:1711 length:690 start_codon:yes stop_codon:yes gene_type:complete